jgi:hypothetical protein
MTNSGVTFMRGARQRVNTAHGESMADDIEELLENVEEEFGIVIPDPSALSTSSPNELVEYILRNMPAPGETVGEDEQLEYVESVLGELMIRTYGISRYDADLPIAEIVAASVARGPDDEA